MAKKFLTSLDLLKNEIQNTVVQNLSVEPANPKEGQIYFNTTTHKLCVFENGAWTSYPSLEVFTEELNKKANLADVNQQIAGLEQKITDKDSLPTRTGHANEWLTNDGTDASWSALPSSSTDVAGIVKLASDEEIEAGTSTTVAVSVKNLADVKAVVTSDKSELEGKINAEKTAREEADTKHTSDIEALQSGKANKADTLVGYGITDAYTKSEVDAKVSSVYKYKGSVETYAELPTENNVEGDVWNVAQADKEHGVSAGDNVAWVNVKGEVAAHWDVLAGTVDLTNYYAKDEIDTKVSTLQASIDANAGEIAELDADKQAKLTEDQLAAVNSGITTEKVAKYDAYDAAIKAASNKEVHLNEVLTPAGGVATWEIVHNLGENVNVTIKIAATGEEVFADVAQSENKVTIKINADAEIAANTYKVVIIG